MIGKASKRKSPKLELKARPSVATRKRSALRSNKFASSREELAATLDAAEFCIFVVDPVNFGLVVFNKAFKDLILKTRGVHVRPGMRTEDIDPQRALFWNKLFQDVLEHGSVNQDYQIPSIRTVHHIFAQPLLLGGRVSGICVFGHDITARKHMESALRKSEEKFSKAFRESPISLALTSMRDHRYLEVNDAFLDATGYTLEEVIGKTPFDIGLWVKPEERSEAIQELISGGTLRNRELLYKTKSGQIRHAVASAATIDVNDEPCMLAVSHDITEQKRAIQALQESEERLRLAIAAGHMYAFEWDPASDLIKRSEQSEAILGVARAESLHMKQEAIEMVLPEDREQYVQILRSLSPENATYRAVFRIRRRDGSVLWLEESGRAFFNPDGQISKVLGMTSDVTDIRESERTLRELSGRLISTQEEERRRIAMELHDHIGQEVALLCVLAQRLASGKSDPDRNEANDLYRRIKELATDVSKLSHRLHSTELDLLGLAAAAERLCRDFGNQYGVVMDYSARDLPPKLEIAKARCLYRVLQEALQNIAKHSHASRVTVQLNSSNQLLTLKVKDNGVGFDTRNVRFQSGLGLVSIRERLHLAGGQFTLTSNQGSGTTIVARVSTEITQ